MEGVELGHRRCGSRLGMVWRRDGKGVEVCKKWSGWGAKRVMGGGHRQWAEGSSKTMGNYSNHKSLNVLVIDKALSKCLLILGISMAKEINSGWCISLRWGTGLTVSDRIGVTLLGLGTCLKTFLASVMAQLHEISANFKQMMHKGKDCNLNLT